VGVLALSSLRTVGIDRGATKEGGSIRRDEARADGGTGGSASGATQVTVGALGPRVLAHLVDARVVRPTGLAPFRPPQRPEQQLRPHWQGAPTCLQPKWFASASLTPARRGPAPRLTRADQPAPVAVEPASRPSSWRRTACHPFRSLHPGSASSRRISGGPRPGLHRGTDRARWMAAAHP
jgi:hypothetical protein